ncbi:KLHDC3 [Cordylochernes scorpioides]|nr:KLHDC3 [Cordylochernes scorpioides]
MPDTTGIVPSSRDGHASAVVGDYMYTFGGYIEALHMFSQDLFRINLRTKYWEFISTQGELPTWRDFHTFTPIGTDIYVFGGRGDASGAIDTQSEEYCNSLTFLDTLKMEWIRPHTNGRIPIGRRSHSAFVFEDRLYIFGGYNSLFDTHFNDLHCYTPSTENWQKVKTYGISGPPCPRRRQSICAIKNRVFLFGGTSPDPNLLEYHHNLLERLQDHGDLYVLDLWPSLKTLSILSVIKHKLDYSCLPKDIKFDINFLIKQEASSFRN